MFFKVKSTLQIKELIFCLEDISKEYFGQGRDAAKNSNWHNQSIEWQKKKNLQVSTMTQ